MAARTKQQYKIFTNNSQLILGTQNSLIFDNNNGIQSSSTVISQDPLSMLSPIKNPSSLKQLRSHSQNILQDIQTPEPIQPLPKIKRPRHSDNAINLFQEAKQQQIQHTLIDSTNQGVISQKLQPTQSKKSMSDMLQDWLVNSNSNLTYHDILSKHQNQSDSAQQNPQNLQNSNATPSINTSQMNINTQNENPRLSLITQVHSTPIKNFRKSDNIYTSPSKKILTSEYSSKAKGIKDIYEAIEKQNLISSATRTPSNGGTFIKDQIDLQASKNQRQSEKFKSSQDQQDNGQDTISSNNTQSLENTSSTIPNIGGQAFSVRNSAQKWFSNGQSPGINNQPSVGSSMNKLTSSMISQPQQNILGQKQSINQTNILTSILSHNNTPIKKQTDLGSGVPGKTNNKVENSNEPVTYLIINQNGHQIPAAKSNATTQNTYNTSIGTKPNISLRRDKIRNTSLISIDTAQQYQQADNVRNFLGIEKPTEEKPTIVKINNAIQQNGNSLSVGRFKIRKLTHQQDEGNNQPSQYQINIQNQKTDDSQQISSLSYLPSSPTLSPQMRGKRHSSPLQNFSTAHNSIPSLQLNNLEMDQNSSNSENNTNNPINQNQIESPKKITLRKVNVQSECEINSNKLEILKLQQAWDFDKHDQEQEQQQQLQQQQQFQQQQQQHQQQSLMKAIIQQQQPSNQIYSGDNFSHFQFIKGAVLKSKGILKTKSIESQNPPLNQQQGEVTKIQSPDQIDRKNFHAPEISQQANIKVYSKLRGQRKYNSMINLPDTLSQNIQRRKCVNFKETLRVINLYRGTESVERLKKPLTGSVIF